MTVSLKQRRCKHPAINVRVRKTSSNPIDHLMQYEDVIVTFECTLCELQFNRSLLRENKL